MTAPNAIWALPPDERPPAYQPEPEQSPSPPLVPVGPRSIPLTLEAERIIRTLHSALRPAVALADAAEAGDLAALETAAADLMAALDPDLKSLAACLVINVAAMRTQRSRRHGEQ
jgi:hypothetical protein